MCGLGEHLGRWNATAHRPDQTCPCPGHALQKSPTIDAVVVEVLQFLIDQIFVFVGHLASRICVTFAVDNSIELVLFQVKIEGGNQKLPRLSGPHGRLLQGKLRRETQWWRCLRAGIPSPGEKEELIQNGFVVQSAATCVERSRRGGRSRTRHVVGTP
jgi:hypothetical protein